MLIYIYKKRNIMEDIKTGDVLLVATKSWLGRVIRKVTKAKWSHAAIFVWLWGELFVIEAEKHGIQLTKWSDPKYNSGNPKKRTLLYLTPIKEVNEKEMAMMMLPHVGVNSYDYIGLLDQLIYQYTGKWIGRKSNGHNKFYCSEFVAYIYHKLDKDYFPKWWEISPGQVFTDKFKIKNK